MRKVNGEAILEVDDVGEGLPRGRRGSIEQLQTSITAHCNASFAKRRMPVNVGGDFRRQPGKRTEPVGDFGLRPFDKLKPRSASEGIADTGKDDR